MGAIFVPLNTKWTPREVLGALKDCSPAAILVDRSVSESQLGALRNGGLPKATEVVKVEEHDNESLVDVPPVVGKGDMPYAIFYTSGTTGPPKGVVLSHSCMLVQVRAKLWHVNYRESTVYLHLAPLFHLGGANSSLAVILAAGQTIVSESTAPATLARTITSYGVNTLVVVPTILTAIVDGLEKMGQRAPMVRDILCGGSAMSVDLRSRAGQSFPGARLIQAYGMTETASTMTFLDHNLVTHDARHASVGQPAEHVKIRILVGDDGVVGPKSGEIITRGPHVMLGYWKNIAATRASIVSVDGESWLRTGDLGRIDNDGYLYVSGRKKDVVKTGGESVSAREVELAIEEIAGVRECAVVGLPDAKYGETVAAAVVKADGSNLTESGVQAALRRRIARFKVPKKVMFYRELPKNSGGKVQKQTVVYAMSGDVGDAGRRARL